MPRISTTKPVTPLVTINTSPAEPAPPQTTAPPVEEKSPTWFWDMCSAITREEWGKIYEILLFRMGDSKVPMAPGEKGYLDVFTEPITPAVIKAKYGGGKFRAVLNKSGRFKTSHDFEIEGASFYDTRRERPSMHQAAGNGESAVVQQVVSMLREELNRMREQIADTDDGGATEKAVDMLSKASEKAMDMIKGQVPTATSPLSQLKDLLSAAKEMGIFGAGGNGGIRETLSLLKEMGIIGATANDPLKSVDTMLGIFTKLDELRGSGGGGRKRDWKEVAVEKVLDLAPDVMDTINKNREANLEIARSRARVAASLGHAGAEMPGRGTVPLNTPPSGPSTNFSANPGLRTVRLDGSVTTPLDTPPAAAANPGVMETVMIETLDRNTVQYENMMKQVVVEMVIRGNYGEQIVDYLDGAKPGYSANLTKFSPEQITAFYARDPILMYAVQNPRWPEVLEEARDYLLKTEPPEGEEEPEPAPMPVRRKARPN